MLTKFSSLPLHPNRFLKNAFLIFAILIVLFSFVGYASAAFAGGDGTLANPYQIETETHLINIGSNLNSHFILIDDITLTAPWTPLGSSATPFTGSLNGDGHTIYGLSITISPPAFDVCDAGFFSHTYGASITNLMFDSAVVQGSVYVGVIAANANNTVLDNVFVIEGNVGRGISDAISTGGLIGITYFGTIIRNSSTSGQVSGASNVSGFVGTSISGLSIYNSSTSMSVTGAYAGGFIGVGEGNIIDSYVTGDVTSIDIGGWETAGGFIGANRGTSLISRSFVTGNVTATGATSHIGGFVGDTAVGTLTIQDSLALNQFVDGPAPTTHRDIGTILDGSVFTSNVYVWNNTTNAGNPITSLMSSNITDSPDVWRVNPGTGVFGAFGPGTWTMNYFGKFLLPVHQWSIDSELGYPYVIADATHLIPRFMVVYDGNLHRSGTVPADLTIHLATDVATILGPGDLAKPGYVFTGWRTFDGVLPVETFQLGDTRLMTTSVVLFAQWKPETSANGGGGGSGNGTGNATIVPPVTVTPPTGNVTPPDSGEDIGYVSPPETGSVPEESSISWLWWLLLLIGILLVIFFFILLCRRRKKEEDEQKMK